MKSPARALAAAACGVALALALAGCGSGSDAGSTRTEKGDLQATPSAQVTAAPAADAVTVAITLADGKVDPNGERVKIKRDQPVIFKISADKPGQIHVHSTPEHQIDVPAGDSEITMTFDQPGVVDVEDHALDTLIVQLEVR